MRLIDYINILKAFEVRCIAYDAAERSGHSISKIYRAMKELIDLGLLREAGIVLQNRRPTRLWVVTEEARSLLLSIYCKPEAKV